jgi:hypothetical protein
MADLGGSDQLRRLAFDTIYRYARIEVAQMDERERDRIVTDIGNTSANRNVDFPGWAQGTADDISEASAEVPRSEGRRSSGGPRDREVNAREEVCAAPAIHPTLPIVLTRSTSHESSTRVDTAAASIEVPSASTAGGRTEQEQPAMTSIEKLREMKARRKAHQMGLALSKSRIDGTYGLADLDTTALVAGNVGTGFGMTMDEIDVALSETRPHDVPDQAAR